MSKAEWRKTWIQTLVDAGIFLDTAEDAFDVCYGKQEIDLASDPEVEASAFLPQQMHGQMYTDKTGLEASASKKTGERRLDI